MYFADFFKYAFIHWFKAYDILKFAQDVAINYVIDKVKPKCKLSYNVFEEQYGYDPFLEISLFPVLIQFIDYLSGVQHCVTGVGKWFFDSSINFVLPLTFDDLDYCCSNKNETKVLNGNKGLFKYIFLTEKYMFFSEVKIHNLCLML